MFLRVVAAEIVRVGVFGVPFREVMASWVEALGLLATMLAANSPVVASAASLAGFATTLLANRP